ncbi:MAG: DUF6062 family protein [bacterium]
MKHTAYFNLLDVLKESGCAICSLIKKSVHKSMDSFLYEQINDSGVRKEIRESLGFCNRHAWQLQKFGDGLGLSIIYRYLSELLIDKMDKKVGQKTLIKKLLQDKEIRNFQKIQNTCRVCKGVKEVERRYIGVFIDNFEDAEFQFAFKNSFGLCLPHLLTVLRLCKERKVSVGVLKIELVKIKSIIEELKEFERKYDYRFSGEKFGKGGDSWIRAIEKLAGKEDVF